MKIPVILTLFITVLIFQNCNKTTTPSSLPQLSLQLDYLATTEAELKLTLTSPVIPHDFQLLRDNTVIMAGSMKTTDTTLYDTTLFPASNYTYQAVVRQSNGVTVQSPALSLTTLDTTSHSYSWEIFSIGNSPIENELFNSSRNPGHSLPCVVHSPTRPGDHNLSCVDHNLFCILRQTVHQD